MILPFRCEAQWSDNGGGILLDDVFDVQSTYIHGRSACLFKAKDVTNQRLKQISTADRNILLKAVLYDKGTNLEHPSSTVTVRFIPQVYVEQRELNFNPNVMSLVVEVQGSLSQLSGIKVRFFQPLPGYLSFVRHCRLYCRSFFLGCFMPLVSFYTIFFI